jgi:citrate lyase subunit beta/citryl-CoA lyase
VPPLTWLYVPADRPDRVEKAIASEAHAVIVDLEDGVASSAKEEARSNLFSLLDRKREKHVGVRINPPRTALGVADLEAVGSLAGADGIHVPKVAGADDVRAVLSRLPPRESPYRLHCLLESAAALEAAYTIATCDPAVAAISLGEADLRSETGALESGLDWARGRVVNAAVAAGLPRPPQSVFPHVDDEEGLARSCSHGRALGHLGRAAIHPRQLLVIEAAYLPTEAEVSRARETVERLGSAAAATTLAGGEFVDAAMLGAARQVLAIAERYGTSSNR